MVKLTAIPYEQARLEFFQSLLDKANRRLDWALKNKPDDYNALSERGEEVGYLNWAVEQATQALPAARNLDIVNVVRCKDCIYRDPESCDDGLLWCNRLSCSMMYLGYCSDGERG